MPKSWGWGLEWMDGTALGLNPTICGACRCLGAQGKVRGWWGVVRACQALSPSSYPCVAWLPRGRVWSPTPVGLCVSTTGDGLSGQKKQQCLDERCGLQASCREEFKAREGEFSWKLIRNPLWPQRTALSLAPSWLLLLPAARLAQHGEPGKRC